MATHKILYATSASITKTLASLASSATFVAGRELLAIDNSSNLYDDILLGGVIRVGTTPTVNTQILIFAFAPIQQDTPTWPDTMTGADAARTVTSVGVGQGFLRLAAALNVDATTSNRDYAFGGVSLASLFGGTMPKKCGLFLAHNTGVALNATEGQHLLNITGVNYTIV
jgi:hypothetical protein